MEKEMESLSLNNKSTEETTAVESIDTITPSDMQSMRIIDLHGNLLDFHFLVQIWIFSKSLFIWIGNDKSRPSLSSMSTAIPTRFSPMPLVSSLLGSPEMEEQQIAQRLSRRTKLQTFVSCQLPMEMTELTAFIEKKITERLKQENIIAIDK